MRYYTADPHFGHENIIHHCDRPYSTVEAMDEAIIDAWRQRLEEDDVLYVLGDLGGPPTSTQRVRSLLKKCPASIKWTMGNHDRDDWAETLDSNAVCLGNRVEIRTEREDPRDDHPVFLVLDHYPMAS